MSTATTIAVTVLLLSSALIAVAWRARGIGPLVLAGVVSAPPPASPQRCSSPDSLDQGGRRHGARVLTVEEAARVLSVSRTRVFDLIRTKRLRSRKIGRARRIPVEAIHEFVKLGEHEAVAG